MAFSIHQGDLCIRGMLPADAAAVQRCRNLPEVVRYQSWRPATVDEVVALSHEQVGRSPGMQREPFQVVIEASDAGGRRQVAGDLGSGAFDPGRQMEIGVVLDPAWQGRGIATRACRMLIDHLFGAGLHRVTARIDPRNAPSIRLFQRLQFSQEGVERQCFWDSDYGEWADEVCFAMLACDWPGAREV